MILKKLVFSFSFFPFLQIISDLQYIKKDIRAVERRRIELYRIRDRSSAKLKMLDDDPFSRSARSSLIDKHGGATISRTSLTSALNRSDLQNRKTDARTSASYLPPRKDSHGGSENHNPTQSGLVLARKKRVHAQVSNPSIVTS